MIRKGFDAKRYIELVSNDWLKGLVQRSGCQGVVVGLSGGVDSSVVAGICERAFPELEKRMGVIMPCDSNPRDAEHGIEAAKKFNMPFTVMDLSSTFAEIQKINPSMSPLARANTKSRLRMVTLYSVANSMNFMVVGTSNLPEMVIGYFTKFGDGGVDCELISELTKDEVRACARELGVPEPIITKPPSAGLWDGQTDEGELGFTYDQLDAYILGNGEAVPVEVREKIHKMFRASEHKRALPPSPSLLMRAVNIY